MISQMEMLQGEVSQEPAWPAAGLRRSRARTIAVRIAVAIVILLLLGMAGVFALVKLAASID